MGEGSSRELIAMFHFGMDFHELEKGVKKVEHTLKELKGSLFVLAEAFALHEIYEFIEANIKVMTAIERTSIRLGISTEQVQLYQYASKRLGLEIDDVGKAMTRMQINQVAAADGSKKQAEMFAKLGIKVKDTNGKLKKADDLFGEVADSISKETDSARQAAMAAKIFGRQIGPRLLPLLKKGSAAVGELKEKFEELGGGFDEDVIEKAKEAEEASADTSTAWISLKGTIMKGLLPVFTLLQKGVTFLIVNFRKMINHTAIVQAALIVLGGVFTYVAATIVVAMWPVIAPFIAIGLAILAVMLAVDDLIVTFQGGQSIIRDVIDSIFGKGATADAVKDIKSDWTDMVEIIKRAYEWVMKYSTELKQAAKILGWVISAPMKLLNMPAKIIGGAAYDFVKQKQAESKGFLQPGEFGPALPPDSAQFTAANTNNAPVTVNNTTNINPPMGTDPEKIGEAVAAGHAKVFRKATRQAANALPRGTAQGKK